MQDPRNVKEVCGFHSRTIRKMTRKELRRQRFMQSDQQATVGAKVLWPADEVEPINAGPVTHSVFL